MYPYILLQVKSDQRIRNQVKNLDILYCSSRYFREKEMKDERVVDFVGVQTKNYLSHVLEIYVWGSEFIK